MGGTWKYDTGVLTEINRITNKHRNRIVRAVLVLFWMLMLPGFVVAYMINYSWWKGVSEAHTDEEAQS